MKYRSQSEAVTNFWKRVDKTPGLGPHGNCWEWLGAKNEDGYGLLRIFGQMIGAHRFAWKLDHPTLTLPPEVCHTCDWPPCVRGEHLFGGNRKDNVADALSKGRMPQLLALADKRRQMTTCRHGHPLTPENVYIGTNGSRDCRSCRRRRRLAYYHRQKGKPWSSSKVESLDRSLSTI